MRYITPKPAGDDYWRVLVFYMVVLIAQRRSGLF
jgi:hypothetical protein